MAEDVSQEVVSEGLEHLKPNRPTRAMVYEALLASNGNKSAVCRDLGCRRQYLNDIINTTPELVILLDELQEGMVDKSEQNIYADVEKGDQSASRFVVSTIGKKRGWSQGVEGTGKNGAITVEITQFSAPSEVPSGENQS